jgi:transcriptional regulator with XRE-family HTH domain
MDLRRTFAANVVKLRADRGISQEDLAHQAEINRSYLSDLENARTYVGLEILGKIADVLGVEGADLLKKAKPTSPKRK